MKKKTYNNLLTINYKLLLWSLTERFGASAVSLVGNILLAALLTPDDFGLVAMLGIFTSLVYALIDCGMSDALLPVLLLLGRK